MTDYLTVDDLMHEDANVVSNLCGNKLTKYGWEIIKRNNKVEECDLLTDGGADDHSDR